MLQAIKQDLFSLLKSPFSLFVLFVPMPLITLLLYFALGSGILYKMPIGIIDLDHSNPSREIIFSLNASPSLKVKQFYTSLEDAKTDLQNAKIFALLVIPNGLQSNSKKGIPTALPLYYNAQFLLVAKTLQSKILRIIGVENVKLKMAKNLVENKTFIGALSKSAPIMQQITALYNPDSSYAQFLITAILPCSLVILVCASLLNSLLRHPISSLNQAAPLLQTLQILFAKILNNTLFYMLWWWILMEFLTKVMLIPMRGDFKVLALSAFMMIFSYNLITLFIFALTKEATRAISFISVYSAPSFAFAGITFPTNSMNTFAVFWSSFLPVSYYLQIYIQQANYGTNPLESLQTCIAMLPFWLFGILGLFIFLFRQKRITQCIL